MARQPTTTAAAPPESFAAWKARALAGLDPIAVGLARERELTRQRKRRGTFEMTAYNNAARLSG